MSDLCRRAALLGVVAVLAGCGFRPVYLPEADRPAGAQAQLGTVRIALLGERSGQLLRQELQARMDRGDAAAKRYELSVNFGIATDVIGVQQDTSFTRLRMVGTANWTLRSLDPSRAIVTSGLARSLDGVNVLDQQYFEVDLAGEAATRRIAGAVAEQITLQLASYFARTPSAG